MSKYPAGILSVKINTMQYFRKVIFNLWYIFGDPPWNTGVSPPELIEFIQSQPPGRALDLGCGTGTNAITLAKHGWQVTALDFAGAAIRQARRKANESGLKIDFRIADATDLSAIHGPFDLILDIGCFHSLTGGDISTYIDNLERLLAPEGTFLMYGFFKSPNESGPGLLENDVSSISSHFKLVDRQDGTERGQRPSAWFTFKKTPSGQVD